MASEWASEDWKLAEEDGPKPSFLFVRLRRRVHIFPLFRFVFAEGDNAAVKMVFASHEVLVTGQGLTALLAALAANRLAGLIQPTENEAQFGVRGTEMRKCSGPAITSITVEEV